MINKLLLVIILGGYNLGAGSNCLCPAVFEKKCLTGMLMLGVFFKQAMKQLWLIP